ncbi:MAG TPA: hypothetical protein PLF44_03525 [Candidatus Mcinerneyibacteriales bacterium]|jgi:hypothetical protein|nr:hypothetical protein [Candidatus Mcinerneyibacteriales bacterium]HPE20010.1 hypothetical protein [Candidatus Mcinerneyibacteriales bacterium]HPJ69930.1 hypothetical protein [Candidatus Mcinerneyibacteriales bacterium]
MKKNGATLVEFIAAMSMGAVFLFLFFQNYATIYLIHGKEASRQKADAVALAVLEEIMALDYNDLLLADTPPGTGTSYSYPGNPVTIDDKGTPDPGDDLTGTITWVVLQETDPDGGGEYKTITVTLRWTEMKAGSEGQGTSQYQEDLVYVVRIYEDAAY